MVGFVLHNTRIAGTVAMGLLRRKTQPPPAGLGLPHVYRARAGFLDLDGYLHLNNGAYLLHAELARWNWMAHAGLLPFVAKRKVYCTSPRADGMGRIPQTALAPRDTPSLPRSCSSS